MKKKKTISYLQVTNTIFRSLGFADWFVGLSRYRISSEIIAGAIIISFAQKGGRLFHSYSEHCSLEDLT